MGVENITEVISRMATSTEKRSAASCELTRDVDSKAVVFRSNATAVGEAACAAETASSATGLKELVSDFMIEREAPVASSYVRRVPRVKEPSRQLHVAAKHPAEESRRKNVQNI